MKKFMTVNKRFHFFVPLLLSSLFFLGSELKAQQNIKALFLGNSYTGVNNLPQIISDIAQSVGDTLIFDSRTPGGYNLEDHSLDAVSQGKISAGGWDYIVLQGQSQEPITNPGDFASGISSLYNQIRQYNPCNTIMFYMTWGRKNGDASNCIPFPVMCTYEGMDTTLRDEYLEKALFVNGEVSPVSVVWRYIRENHPGIELYQPDESHPSAAGSYAAACCFYAAIFKKDPALITYNFSLNATDASIIKNAAKMIVYDNLSLWDFVHPPVAEFGYTTGSGVNEVVFSLDPIATVGVRQDYFWDFGDGDTSTLSSPTHSYLSDGTYTVGLTTTNCNLQGAQISFKDTIIQFCSHTPTITVSNPWLCNIDTLWVQPADTYQWFVSNSGNYWMSIPETNQYLPDYGQYGQLFSVVTTTGSCSELSQVYSAVPSYLLYYLETVGIGAVTVADTALLIIRNLYGVENIQWYKDNVALPLETNDTLIVIASAGTYHCTITNPNSPLDTAFTSQPVDISYLTGVEGNVQDAFWSVAPNPVTERLTIKFEGATIREQVQIYNALGQLVKEMEASKITVVNISDLQAGVYFIRLKNNKQPAIKCIKQ